MADVVVTECTAKVLITGTDEVVSNLSLSFAQLSEQIDNRETDMKSFMFVSFIRFL